MSDTVTVTLHKGTSREAIYKNGVKIYARGNRIFVSKGKKEPTKKHHKKQKFLGLF
jgi:hypothetical protein